jgi:hypothetical protein
VAFLDSSSSVVQAILTRKGRELLAKNDGSFKIAKFAFFDDEINYQLYNAADANNPDTDILNLPILEPVSNEDVAARYRLITLPKGSLKIATLTVNPTVATVNYGDNVNFTVKTSNGTDSQGYKAQSRDTDIAKLVNDNEMTDSAGVATFTVYTGANAGSKSGSVYLDITGINTGARSTILITVSSSGV